MNLRYFAAQMALDANNGNHREIMGFAIGLCGTVIAEMTQDKTGR